MRGVVQRVMREDGYGFIQGEDGQEFFFHRTGLNATGFEELEEGVQVKFSVSGATLGYEPAEQPRAVNVRLAPGERASADNEPLPERAGEG